MQEQPANLGIEQGDVLIVDLLQKISAPCNVCFMHQ